MDSTLNSIFIIVVALGFVLNAIFDVRTHKQLFEVEQKVRCLERGTFYVGNNLCVGGYKIISADEDFVTN